ncbi:addiction module protein [Methylobacter sp.]|uniref:addiction module protein n=1 Tax=Methylobacter sp. TaxID=2051955 RepID=UPI0025E7F4DA|nr:addiction module protein [Methylobacter sp.]
MIIKKQAKGSRRKAQGFFTLNLSPASKLPADLDTPNPEINAIWRKEAQKRWQAYKAGELKTVSYEAVMQKYQ